jgi:hypothetical protein
MGARGAWLRARPGDRSDFSDPFLKHPGSNRLRTVPDGLWLCFGGNEKDPYVDVFAIEACCSFTNLLDKRSRFAPSMPLAAGGLPGPLAAGDRDNLPCHAALALYRAAAQRTYKPDGAAGA